MQCECVFRHHKTVIKSVISDEEDSKGGAFEGCFVMLDEFY